MDFKTDKEWLVIVNPNAGRKKGIRDWGKISDLLDHHDFSYYPVFTEYPRHAIQLSCDLIGKGFKKVIVVGGDGTMNEVVNGLFLQKRYRTTQVILGMVTVGTGNDWGRMFNIPKDYEQAILVLKKCQTYVQDAGTVKYMNSDEHFHRYFINIAGLGFDAVVTKKTNAQKEKGRSSTLLYFYNIISSLFSYSYADTCISIDGKDYRNKVFSMNVGIGKYNGGGMMQLPAAIADDGLFDLTIIKKISKPDLIVSLKRLYNGTIAKHPKVTTYTGKEIRIDSSEKILLETDGESLGHTPLEFNIIPKSIRVITGQPEAIRVQHSA